MKIIINTTLMVPIYEQVADQIKTLIRNGELKENDNLPSVRTLSKELRISALTVKRHMTIWKAKVLPLLYTEKEHTLQPRIQNFYLKSKKKNWKRI